MSLVAPERWYMAFWIGLGAAFLVLLVFAVAAGIVLADWWLRKHGGA